MSLNKTSFVAGNIAFEGYERDGLIIRESPVQETIQFQIPTLSLGQKAVYDFQQLNVSIIAKSIWGVKDTAITQNDRLDILIKDKNTGNILFPINLEGKLNANGNTFTYSFDYNLLNKERIIEVIPSFNLLGGIIFGSEGYTRTAAIPATRVVAV